MISEKQKPNHIRKEEEEEEEEIGRIEERTSGGQSLEREEDRANDWRRLRLFCNWVRGGDSRLLEKRSLPPRRRRRCYDRRHGSGGPWRQHHLHHLQGMANSMAMPHHLFQFDRNFRNPNFWENLGLTLLILKSLTSVKPKTKGFFSFLEISQIIK